jgi:hypothetical protein
MMVALVAGAGCGPVIENARFSARPDSLEPGDLLGPYDGSVVDGETERVVASAVVVGTWAFEHGIGLRGPAFVREVAVETGADGRYQLPRPEDLPGGSSMHLRRFTLVVYRRGYVGYRSDFKFVTGDVRHDFSQHGNKVRLEKWQSGFEHGRHLAFLGSAEAIVKVAGWEAQPASLEYGGVAVAPTPVSEARQAEEASPKLLDVSPLLSVEEVRGVTGYAGELDVGRLMDRVRTEDYDSRHFKAAGKPEAYDVGLRVWASSPDEAESQFRKLAQELPAATPTEEIGDRSIRARGGEVLGLAFLLRERGVVVQISCGVLQCTDAAMILRLGKLVESHLGELRIPAAGTREPLRAPVPTPAPEAPEETRP